MAAVVAFEKANALQSVFFLEANLRTQIPFDSNDTPDTSRVFVLDGTGTAPNPQGADPLAHTLPSNACKILKLGGSGPRSSIIWYRNSINAGSWDCPGGKARLTAEAANGFTGTITTLNQAINDLPNIIWVSGGKRSSADRPIKTVVNGGIKFRQERQSGGRKKPFKVGDSNQWGEVLDTGLNIGTAILSTIGQRYTAPVEALLKLPTTVAGLKQLEKAVEQALDVIQTGDYGPGKLSAPPAGGG